jgi:hypothetical protein
MDWLLTILALIAVAVFAFRQGARTAEGPIREMRTAQAHDRMNYLSTLRRELANYLIWRDPNRYVRLYSLIHAETAPIKDLAPASLHERLAALCEKYPNYEDFDPIGTRDYVLYDDTLSGELDEIEQRYRDIAMFQAVMIASTKSWKCFHATNAKELEHLNGYVKRVHDTKLRLRLEQAVREHYIWEAGKEANPDDPYQSQDFSVCRVGHYAENRYGIEDKKTREFGLYGVFVADDGRLFNSYYRSDPAFEREEHLDKLHGLVQSA